MADRKNCRAGMAACLMTLLLLMLLGAPALAASPADHAQLGWNLDEDGWVTVTVQTDNPEQIEVIAWTTRYIKSDGREAVLYSESDADDPTLSFLPREDGRTIVTAQVYTEAGILTESTEISWPLSTLEETPDRGHIVNMTKLVHMARILCGKEVSDDTAALTLSDLVEEASAYRVGIPS